MECKSIPEEIARAARRGFTRNSTLENEKKKKYMYVDRIKMHFIDKSFWLKEIYFIYANPQNDIVSNIHFKSIYLQ